MSAVSSITIIGANSGTELLLDVDTLTALMEWYVKLAPTEARSLSNFLKVIRLHDNIQDLKKKELEFSAKYINQKLDGTVADEYLDGSI